MWVIDKFMAPRVRKDSRAFHHVYGGFALPNKILRLRKCEDAKYEEDSEVVEPKTFAPAHIYRIISDLLGAYLLHPIYRSSP